MLREAKERFLQQAANPADPFGSNSCGQQHHDAPEFRAYHRSSRSDPHHEQPRRGADSGAAHPATSSGNSRGSSSSSSSSGSSRGPHWTSSDPFQCLKLPTRAPAAQVKAQYRRLCLLYHPDKSAHPQATEAFIAITTAYRMLSNQATG